MYVYEITVGGAPGVAGEGPSDPAEDGRGPGGLYQHHATPSHR